MDEPIGFTSASLAMLTAVLWGGTAVAISFSVESLPPIAVAGFRFLLASLVMWGWCRYVGVGISLPVSQWKYPLIAGSLLFGQISLFNVGVMMSNSSHGSLLINCGIFGVVALDHFVTKNDRLNLWKSIGLAIAAGCVLTILLVTGKPDDSAGSMDQPSLVGDLFLLASAGVLSVLVIYTKHAVIHVSPSQLILWHDVVGTILFFVWSLLFETIYLSKLTAPAVVGLLYQGVFVAGFCFAIQAHLLAKHSASKVSVFGFAMPLFGILFGSVFRGDPLTVWIVFAGMGVAVGIVLVNSPVRKKR